MCQKTTKFTLFMTNKYHNNHKIFFLKSRPKSISFLLLVFSVLNAYSFSDTARRVTLRIGFGTYGYATGFNEKRDAFSVQLNLQAKIGKKTSVETDFLYGSFYYRNKIIPGTDWQSQLSDLNYSLLLSRQLFEKGRFGFLVSTGLCFVRTTGNEPQWKTTAYIDTVKKPNVVYIYNNLEATPWYYNSISFPLRGTFNYKISKRLNTYLTLGTYFEPDPLINYFRGTALLIGFGYAL